MGGYRHGRRRRRDLRGALLRGLCALVMVACALYIGLWLYEKSATERDNAAYSALYAPANLENGANEAAPSNGVAEPAGGAAIQSGASLSPGTARGASESDAATALPTNAAAPQSTSAQGATDSEQTQSPGAAQSASESQRVAISEQTPASPQSASAQGATASVSAQGAPQSDSARPAPVRNSADGPESKPAQNASPTASASPSAAGAWPNPSASPAPQPIAQDALLPRAEYEIPLDATRAPLATPDANTLVYALETPPPPQAAFAPLLALNPDTVGFLQIEGVLSLPVAQRPNDNEYYLDHNFEGAHSDAGTLFLDGANLLVPEDRNLLVYGHNMRNGTMFHSLGAYSELDFLKSHPVARFDTLYKNRAYVPFAALSVTAQPGSERYLNIRQFGLEGDALERYVESLRDLSIIDIPIDVGAQDDILLLVTCEYTHDDGRFVLALRALRDGETESEAVARVQAAAPR